MTDLPWGLILIVLGVLAGIGGVWLYWRNRLAQRGEPDPDLKHGQLSRETQSRLLGFGMAAQHRRRR